MTHNLVCLTVFEKVFIVKSYYKLNEDVDRVSIAFREQFPVNVTDLIPEVVSSFETTGSVLDDFYYEQPVETEDSVVEIIAESYGGEDDEDNQEEEGDQSEEQKFEVKVEEMLDMHNDIPEGGLEIKVKIEKSTKERKSKKPRTRATPTKKFCEKCNKYINHCFTEHMMTHNESRDFVCSVCEKRFTTIRYLKEHEATHAAQGSYICELCGFTSKTKSNHNSHMRVHGEKKHACDLCSMKFARSQGLRRHRMTHTGEKPYSCKYCDQSFTLFMTHQMHERTHTGERPYKCQHCDRTFIGAPSLNVSLLFEMNGKACCDLTSEQLISSRPT